MSALIRKFLASMASQDEIPSWGDLSYYWPKTPSGWTDEDVARDAYDGVYIREYVSDDGSARVKIDLSDWTSDPRRGTWEAMYWGKTDRGSIPESGYDRAILALLSRVGQDADRAKDALVKRLEGLGGRTWGRGTFDDSSLMFVRTEGELNMVVSFEFILEVLSGEWDRADADIYFTAGSDYEGHIGERRERVTYRSVDEIPKVLQRADRLWKQWAR